MPNATQLHSHNQSDSALTWAAMTREAFMLISVVVGGGGGGVKKRKEKATTFKENRSRESN